MAEPSVAPRRIAVDAMGGDLGPAEVIAGAKLALGQHADLSPITLVGDKAVLEPLLHEAGLRAGPRLDVHHAKIGRAHV